MVPVQQDKGRQMRILESEIEQACVKIAKAHKCILLKIQGAKGYPDRLLLTPTGQAMFMEIKRPGESLRPLQRHILEDLTLKGFKAEEIDSVELFKHCLTGLLLPNGNPMAIKNEV